jgi:hypothetical protein
MVLALVAIALSFAAIAPGINYNTQYANAQSDQNIDLLKIAPKASDTVTLEKVKKLALENEKVKEMTSGKAKVEFMSQDFVGNIYSNPVVWTPEVRFNVDDKYQVIAVVDPENNTVTEVSSAPMEKLTLDFGTRSWAIDYYSGSSTLTGISMTNTTPTYTPTSTDSFTALLVNGLMSGSSTNGCNSNYWPTTAYFQAGMVFYPTTGYSHTGGTIAWTDTQQSCNAQVTSVPYTAGNNYKFQIYSDSVNGDWVIYLYNVSTGRASTVVILGPSTYTLKTDTGQSNVFFENSNTDTISPDSGNPINFNLQTFATNYTAC